MYEEKANVDFKSEREVILYIYLFHFFLLLFVELNLS